MRVNLFAIFRPICWFWDLYHTLHSGFWIHGIWVSAGHLWKEDSTIRNKRQVLGCERCGQIDVLEMQ